MNHLDPAAQAKLFERFGRTFPNGAEIYAESDVATHCFFVVEGRVRLFKKIRSAERTLAVVREGDLFGEEALPGGGKRAVTAVALTDVRALALDQKTFEALVGANSAAAMRVLEQLVRRIRDAEEQLENAMLRDHPSRVVNTLIHLAEQGNDPKDGLVMAITPLELSSRVGLDVDAAKRAVQQLRDGGYIAIDEASIEIKDLEALRRLFQLLGMKEDVRGALA